MTNDQPSFLITIDTEGDNLWSRPREITTRNAEFLPRFQDLCERYGLKPTWLTNYEMAKCPVFREFAQDALRRGTAEVGMHLHAWNSPPIEPLTDDDFRHQPYLINYTPALMREKIWRLTDLLEETFARPMRSHRAGRWAINETYAQLLAERGYIVDCSVTPFVSWQAVGSQVGDGSAADYRGFPTSAYRMDLQCLSRAGDSPLLQVPMTIRPVGRTAVANRVRGWLGGLPLRSVQRLVRYVFPEVHWLRPNGRNREEMIQLAKSACAAGDSYVEFMLHSSEFMPGGSPRFANEGSVDRLYDDLAALFDAVMQQFRGSTLTDFAERYVGDACSAEVPCAPER